MEFEAFPSKKNMFMDFPIFVHRVWICLIEQFQDLIKLKGHVTIINISHKDSNLEFCDKVYEFSNSRVKISL